MSSILEALYMGGIDFASHYHGPDSPYSKAAQEKYESSEKLVATLGENQRKLFEQYRKAQSDMEHISRYTIYTETLKFGIGFMAELFKDNE